MRVRGRAAGPDLARSLVVLNDTAGKELGDYLRTGAPERGMPAFAGLTAGQVADIAEFLHERVEAARNRNPIDPIASVVGDPVAGAAYFSGAGRCSTCHSVTGDLAGIGAKYDPMTLQDRIVSPRPHGGAAPPGPSRSAKTYGHHIVTHTFPTTQEQVYSARVGDQSVLTGASLQNTYNATHVQTVRWITASRQAGRPWVVANDEQGSATLGVPPDPGYPGFTGKDFRQIFLECAAKFADVPADCAYVDAAGLRLVRSPWDFDVLVTENMFGDILSDVGAALMGGMGMAPSADIGDEHAVFQPCHGTAPDIAGRGLVNPTAMFLSAAMMLEWLGERHTLPACRRAAATLVRAVEAAFADGTMVTVENGGTAGTATVTARVLRCLEEEAEVPELSS